MMLWTTIYKLFRWLFRPVSLELEWKIISVTDQHESPTAITNALNNFHAILKNTTFNFKESPKRLIHLCYFGGLFECLISP